MMTECSLSLVSVIIPSFQHARFVGQAMESVFWQTYPEMELIVVDDASRDASPELIAEITQKPEFRRRFHNRVIVELLPQNKGAHHALNRGLELASGDFLAVLNSDDRYHPRRLEQMVDILRPKNRMGFGFSKVRFIDTEGKDVSTLTSFQTHLSIAQDSIRGFPSVGFALLKQQVAISTGNFFWGRELLEHVGNFSGLKYCHDWEYILRCLCVTEPVYVDDLLYEYRLHDENTFRTLRAVADSETEQTVVGYLDAVQTRKILNSIAPSPHNWPGVFDLYLKRFGYTRWWNGRNVPFF